VCPNFWLVLYVLHRIIWHEDPYLALQEWPMLCLYRSGSKQCSCIEAGNLGPESLRELARRGPPGHCLLSARRNDQKSQMTRSYPQMSTPEEEETTRCKVKRQSFSHTLSKHEMFTNGYNSYKWFLLIWSWKVKRDIWCQAESLFITITRTVWIIYTMTRNMY